MWLEICNSDGFVQGHLNLERIDIVMVGFPYGENLTKVTVTQGTVSKLYYIDGSDLHRLNKYLDRAPKQ